MSSTSTISLRILKRAEVLELTTLSKSKLYRLIDKGEFPPPFRLGGPDSVAVGWKEEEVQQWRDELEPAQLN